MRIPVVLVDTHCHIEMKAYNRDRPAVMKRARESGVRKLVTVGIDLEDSRRAVALTAEYEDLYAAVGVHPHDAKSIDGKTYDALKLLAGNEKVVAYGEIGLDFSGTCPRRLFSSGDSGSSSTWPTHFTFPW